MIDNRDNIISGAKTAVAATGLFAASFAVTETAAKTLGFAETDILLATKRGLVGGVVLVAMSMSSTEQAAPPSVWEAMSTPALISATGALLLQGLDNINVADVAKQSIRMALIGSPIWVGLWCIKSQDHAQRHNLSAASAPRDPAPPYRP